MVIAARILRLLAFTVWIGGIVFFGAVVAPTAFRTFGATQLFAEFIARSLLMLHSMGTWCGLVILVTLRMLGARAYKLSAQAGLVLLMIVLTFASNKLVILPMEHDRQASGGDVNLLLKGSPLRDDFDARHAWSTRIEGAIILAGLGLAVLIGMEAGLRERLPSGPPRKVFDLCDDE
jgi:uncharacterized membrane protein